MPDTPGPYNRTVGIRELRADGVTLPGAQVLDVAGGALTFVPASAGQPAKYLLEVDLSALEATAPTADEKAALAGTSGAPGVGNEYVTDDDPRLDEAVPSGAAGLLSGAFAALLTAATSAATALTLVLRDAAGRFKAADPDAADDVATKGYVDGLIDSATTDLATLAATNGRTTTRNPNSLTYGSCIIARKNCTATAIRFYHNSLGAAETIKVSLWDAQTGTRMTFENVSVSASGIVEVALTSSQSLTVGKTYKVTAFNSTNNVNVVLNTGLFDGIVAATIFLASSTLLRTCGVNGAGDVNPTTVAGLYPVHLVAS